MEPASGSAGAPAVQRDERGEKGVPARPVPGGTPRMVLTHRVHLLPRQPRLRPSTKSRVAGKSRQDARRRRDLPAVFDVQWLFDLALAPCPPTELSTLGVEVAVL